MPPSSFQVSSSQGHVVVIDDDAAIRRSLSTLLTRAGYNVSSYESADLFLQNPVLSKPCVILLDMRMPGTLGVDLQMQLQTMAPSVPVVFASGDSRSEEIIRAMKQGAMDFLLKPFTPQTLLDVLQRAMQLAVNTQKQDHRVDKVKAKLKTLTAREFEVCSWIVRGYTNQHIAELDGGAAATVKLHRARVMNKLGVEALPDLIKLLENVELTSELYTEINAPRDPD
ncbi:DNA-binding response regulator [Limnohabitans sp. TS-CS-82]|uniref:response regulator transcription factor n=1 Tax=Limnohabitans sp. TS-CS-82 TaxID=2094193 RepID=UPI000CF2EC6D|nr:response regulator [Limnohabitans sp. TS-CS-82]PQA80847.1 DNA-binding response regulator [Limnohabitans sp. TS-CS-82]